MSQLEGWFVHYVGGNVPPNPTLDDSAKLVRALQRDAQSTARGYTDFEYSFAVDQAGRIFEGRGWDWESGATYHNNLHSWSVVYLGGPTTPLTDEAKASLHWLVQEGARRKPLITYVKPHSAVFPTACPGDALRAFVHELQDHLHDSNDVAPPTPEGTLKARREWAARCAETPLMWGDKSHDVEILKAQLTRHGYDVDPGPLYGQKVVDAVKDFKVKNKLDDRNGRVCGRICALVLIAT